MKVEIFARVGADRGDYGTAHKRIFGPANMTQQAARTIATAASQRLGVDVAVFSSGRTLGRLLFEVKGARHD